MQPFVSNLARAGLPRKSQEVKAWVKVCSENRNDWQYLSLADLEQNEFFPKSKSWGFVVPQRLIKVTWHVTCPKIGEMVANLLCLGKQIDISERG